MSAAETGTRLFDLALPRVGEVRRAAVTRRADARLHAERMRASSTTLALAGVHVDWTTKTSRRARWRRAVCGFRRPPCAPVSMTTTAGR